eukprot:PhF_6_TR37474/c2_g1_i2/m.55191
MVKFVETSFTKDTNGNNSSAPEAPAATSTVSSSKSSTNHANIKPAFTASRHHEVEIDESIETRSHQEDICGPPITADIKYGPSMSIILAFLLSSLYFCVFLIADQMWSAAVHERDHSILSRYSSTLTTGRFREAMNTSLRLVDALHVQCVLTPRESNRISLDASCLNSSSVEDVVLPESIGAWSLYLSQGAFLIRVIAFSSQGAVDFDATTAVRLRGDFYLMHVDNTMEKTFFSLDVSASPFVIASRVIAILLSLFGAVVSVMAAVSLRRGINQLEDDLFMITEFDLTAVTSHLSRGYTWESQMVKNSMTMLIGRLTEIKAFIPKEFRDDVHSNPGTKNDDAMSVRLTRKMTMKSMYLVNSEDTPSQDASTPRGSAYDRGMPGGGAGNALTRRKSMGLNILHGNSAEPLRRVKATVIRATIHNLKALDQHEETFNEAVQLFFRTVLMTIGDDATVLDVTPDSITIGWNISKSQPEHQLMASRCAVRLNEKLIDLGDEYDTLKFTVVLDSGNLHVGYVGNENQRFYTAIGRPTEVCIHLCHLARQIDATCLMTEYVHEHVQAQVLCYAVDACLFQQKETYLPHESSDAITIYSILGLVAAKTRVTPAFQPTEETRIIRQMTVAFNYLRQGKVPAALKELSRIDNHDVDIQRLRLLGLARLMRKAESTKGDSRTFPKPYVRNCGTWVDFESLIVETDDTFGADDATVGDEDSVCMTPKNNRLLGAKKRTGRSFRDNFDDEGHNLDEDIMDAQSQAQGTERASQFGGREDEEGEFYNDDPNTNASAASFSGDAVVDGDADPDAIPDHFEDRRRVGFVRSEHKLGSGQNGMVYLGMDAHTGTMVAIKVVPIRTGTDPKTITKEVGALKKYRHQNIVGYRTAAVAGQYLFIVMEYVSGGSLYSVLQHFQVFPMLSVQRYIRDVLRGLCYLHSRDLVHRDVKPQNVLLTSEGECKLSDFGTVANIAKLGDEAIQGTPLYMAPEAIRGDVTAGKSADVWSVGIMFIQLLSGKNPYPESICANMTAFVYKVGSGQMRPTIPDTFSGLSLDFAESCLAVQPEDRCTAEQLLVHPFLC